MMEEKKREGEKAKRIKRGCGARREHSQNGWFIKDERGAGGREAKPSPQVGGAWGRRQGEKFWERSHRYRVKLSMGFFET